MQKQFRVVWVAVFLFAGTAWADPCPSYLLVDDGADQDGDWIPNSEDQCCFGYDRLAPDPQGAPITMGPCLEQGPDADANGNGTKFVNEGMCCVHDSYACMKADSAGNTCPDGMPMVPCDHLLFYTEYTDSLEALINSCFDGVQGHGCKCYTVVDYDRDGSGPFDNCPLKPNAVSSTEEQPNWDQDLWGDACDSECSDPDASMGQSLAWCDPLNPFESYCGPDSYCVPFLTDQGGGYLDVMHYCSSPPDRDDDYVADECDNCLGAANEDQADRDDDQVGDACDNCPDDPNPNQWEDEDLDGVGNACDECYYDIPEDPTAVADRDGDGVLDVCDNCPDHGNNSQEDSDGDGVGDACDNCLEDENPFQINTDGDRPGDACDMCLGRMDDAEAVMGEDEDFDGIADECDVCPGRMDAWVVEDPVDLDDDGYDDNVCDPCPGYPNYLLDQTEFGLLYWPWPDADGDGIADVCDRCLGHHDDGVTLDLEDSDQDGVPDTCDMCPTRQNFKAAVGEDRDQDGIADFCDDFVDVDTDDVDTDEPLPWEELDDDGDGVANGEDNCPDHSNETQADGDADGQGDACSLFDDYTGAFDCRCNGVGTTRPAANSSMLPLITALASLLL